MKPEAPTILLTDPPPLPQATACPRCGASAEQFIDGGGFGPTRQTLCGVCLTEIKETR